MKKLTAILLSLTLALSLTVPALAAPAPDAAPADGAYTVDGEAVPVYKPGDAIPISAIPISDMLNEMFPDSAGSIGVIGGADGPTSILTSGPLGSFNWDSLDLEGLDPDSADWSELEKQLQEMQQQLIDGQKQALGGVPGQVGVMVNGVYVKFPDAAPEVADGRTMIPVRALVEAVDGEVSYDDGKIVCKTDTAAVTLNVGSDEATVDHPVPEEGDEAAGETIKMDCAPYIKGGRTYVPVRFIAEALGYDVGWDSAYQTAVLLDREALTAQIDENFTILNKVQANKGPALEEGKNYLADVKENFTITLFDTLNENKTYKADLTGKQIFNADAASAQLSLKLSDNALDDLEKLLTEQYGADFEENAILFRAVAEGLDDIEVILTREGAAWFRAAALDELAGKDNVWLGQDLGAEWGELAFTSAGDTTIGSALTAMLDKNSVASIVSLSSMTGMMSSLFGDGKFTTSGGVSTLTIGVDDLFDIYKDMGLSEEDMAEAKAAFKEYEIVMKVDGKGGTTMTCVMETAAQTGVPGMKITMDVEQADGNVTMDMNFHIANMGEIKVEVTQTQKATADKPMTEPPEGSTVVESIEPLAS